MPSQVVTEDRGSEVLPGRALPYRPYLDGLRAVAVYLVVAFHAGLGLFSGGFIGVDIFFVLSGFLVTRILMRDLASLGRIRWRQFYSRRVRRILPAALVALVVTALVYSIVATPAELLDALGGFRAAFFYVANWFFIRQSTNYFAANVNSSPVLHFWSLAIEEQFYLVWPLLLGGLYVATRRAGRRRWWVVRAVVVVAAAASASAALHLGSTNIDRAYYGTDTRAYELLAGAVLALTPQLLRLGPRSRTLARWISVLTLGGLLVLATSVFDMSPITRGVLVAGLAPVLIIALENARRGFARGVLSSSPFTYLGRISYGTYLWHWPVIVIVAHGHDPSPVEMFAISATTATALAALSFHLIEHPIRAARTLDRFKAPVIAIGFATSILVGALAMPAILDSGTGPVGALAGSQSRSGLRLLDWRVAKNDIPDLPDCLGAPVSHCTVAKGNGKRVLLIGDSNARMWIPTFTE
ncbi:MAG TPA: acyltransferase, partial [Acidimicrobiia bacterium]